MSKEQQLPIFSRVTAPLHVDYTKIPNIENEIERLTHVVTKLKESTAQLKEMDQSDPDISEAVSDNQSTIINMLAIIELLQKEVQKKKPTVSQVDNCVFTQKNSASSCLKTISNQDENCSSSISSEKNVCSPSHEEAVLKEGSIEL